jgi:anti-sigma B factor antagonist
MPDTWGLARTAEELFVHGEIDLATADRFEEQALEAVLGTPGSSVLIDLSGVPFVDSAGLRALLRVVELDDGKTLIVQPSRQVFKLLHLTSLVNGELSNVEVRGPT